MTVSDAGEAEPFPGVVDENGSSSGLWTTLSTIGEGMIDEVINHPLRVAGNVVMGVAIGAVAAVALPALGVVGTEWLPLRLLVRRIWYLPTRYTR